MRTASLSLLAALFVLAACETVPISAPGSTSGPVGIPSGPLDLGGDWQHVPASAVLQTFEQTVAGRYAAGLAVTDATADLQQNQFTCAPNHDTTGHGQPPVAVCRKTVTQAQCTHTWQVHLFDTGGDARLARARGLYDRRCGNEGLLGGPT